MNADLQRATIARACGYIWLSNPIRTRTPQGAEGSYDIPDYLNDLNAMHGAEKTLIGEEREIYVDTLASLVSDDKKMFGLVNASAQLRAKAFLMTINEDFPAHE